jgi:hypothetical protein
MRSLLWIAAGSLAAAAVGALLIAWMFTVQSGGGFFAGTSFAEMAVVGLVFTVPSAVAGAVVLLIAQRVWRLNFLVIAASGAAVGAAASLVIDASGELAWISAGIGCVGCIVAYPLLIRANAKEPPDDPLHADL